jgi:hypothetical protein
MLPITAGGKLAISGEPPTIPRYNLRVRNEVSNMSSDFCERSSELLR